MVKMRHWATNTLGLKGVRLREVAKPVPVSGEVLVRVSAVALNYRDNFLLEHGAGTSMSRMTFPFVPASDMAGEVEAIGPDVTEFAVGDNVISVFSPGWSAGVTPDGTTARRPTWSSLGGGLPGVLAEYVCFPEDWFIHAPRRLSAAEASTLPCAGTTAWSALIEQGGVQAGQTVLVHGTGGIATFALKIAQAFGADVIVVSRSEHKLVRTLGMGVRHNINRSDGDWVEEVYRATNDRGADLIVETVGGDNLADSLRALAPGGRIAAVGLLDSAEFRGSLAQLGPKAATISGISVGSRQYAKRFVEAIDERDIKPVIDTIYPFTEVKAAFDHVLRGPFGKVVIDVL